MRVVFPVRARQGFTLLEVCLAIFIAVLLLMLAVPSVSGLLAERKARRSFESFEEMVREAQSRSVTEQRAYVIVWEEKAVTVLPEVPANKDETAGVKRIDLEDEETFEVTLPAALEKKPGKEWIFWPSGTCEPANIAHAGAGGAWTASYDPLTVRANLVLP